MMIIGKNSPDRESLSSDLLAMLAETVHQFGKDEEAIHIALEEHEKNLPYVSNEGFIITTEMIETKQIADSLPLFILLLRYQMGQYDEGYEFYMETEMGYHSDKEIRLYVLLDSLGKGLPETWVHLYERAVADGIEPRKSLQEKYASLKASE